MMAGPCLIESYEQTLASAKAVKAAGGSMLRGGAYKPRTSPYAFQGLGLEGLRILHAQHNHIQVLPRLIGRVKDLTQLRLFKNELRWLPPSLRARRRGGSRPHGS
jgi:3-deoxy-7-phosphoheptulonate synthase